MADKPPIENDLQQTIDLIAESQKADVFLYNAPIDRWQDRRVITQITSRRRRPNAILMLVTEGGDPNVAYRIARAFLGNYTKVSCFVSGYCKSAGTIMAIGAHELIFSEHGELGPIDVQMSKKDELWEWQSGLTVTSALSALNDRAFSAFESFFLETKFKGRGAITLKTCTDVAVKLAGDLYGPIFEQIDPMHVGEAARSIAVARQYGARLNRKSHNLKQETLEILISGFTSHGFVIDFHEAIELFNNVRIANENERKLHECLGDKSCIPLDSDQGQTVIVDFLSKEVEETHASINQGQPLPEHGAQPGIREVPPPTGGGVAGNGETTAA